MIRQDQNNSWLQTHAKNVKPQVKCHGSQLNNSKRFDTDQSHFEIGHSDCIMKKWVGIQQDGYSTQLVCDCINCVSDVLARLAEQKRKKNLKILKVIYEEHVEVIL